MTLFRFRFDSEELRRNIHDVHLSENVHNLKVPHTRAHNYATAIATATAIAIAIIVIISSSRADASLTQSSRSQDDVRLLSLQMADQM